MYSLWLDLSVDTKNFDLVTLTFDLHLKKLTYNFGYNFWTKRDRAFVLHVRIFYGKIFQLVQKFWYKQYLFK